MNKIHYNIFITLFIIFSCQNNKKENLTVNQDIYNFMQVVVEEQNLNFDYGIQIKPESDFGIWETDQMTFNSLISNLENDKKNKMKMDSLNWMQTSVKLNSHDYLQDLTKEDIAEMISQKENLKIFQWDNTKLGFNNSNKNNWYGFSIPLFSKDKNKAILMIKKLCPGLCGEGKTLLFTKKNGKWNSETVMIWQH